MPPIFKALATIMAWIMWIVALVMGFGTWIMCMVTQYGTTGAPPMYYPVTWAVAGFYAIAAVVIMILRKKME